MSSIFFILILGLIFGSFLSSFTYRIIRGEKLPKGRSYCPKCKKTIFWYDNVPLLSYLLLRGRCRSCKRQISLRYPLIELTTTLLFVIIAYLFNSRATILLRQPWSLPFLLVTTLLLIAIFITDLEHQIIPDEVSLLLLVITFFTLMLSGVDTFYVHMFTGFGSALFLLLLNLVTFGRGMGLGDVKLALGLGAILGWPHVLSWLMSSFTLGALVGVCLLFLKKAKWGKHIAFGPFLVISFFIVLVWGDTITSILFPYL